MKVYTIPPIGFCANTFAVTEDGRNCVLIDCAHMGILRECEKLNLTPVAVLLTHGHYDHIGGCGALQNKGADIYCGDGEDKLIFSDANKEIFGDIEMPHFSIKRTLKDSETLSLCGLEIKVISTPGHTIGGVSYVIGDHIFSGDTLFAGSVGRWDFSTGDPKALFASVKKLYALNGDFIVCCGHGENTTLDAERKYNPYVKA